MFTMFFKCLRSVKVLKMCFSVLFVSLGCHRRNNKSLTYMNSEEHLQVLCFVLSVDFSNFSTLFNFSI